MQSSAGYRDVCEVLFRPDSHVHAAGLHRLQESRKHGLKSCFVGKEVFGLKLSSGFRRAIDELPERVVGDLGRQGVCRAQSGEENTSAAIIESNA